MPELAASPTSGVAAYLEPAYRSVLLQDHALYLPLVLKNYNPAEVTIPAGEFWMGCDPLFNGGEVDCELDELPLHKVFLDAYAIDKYEVTNAQYALCVVDGTCSPPANGGSATLADYYGNPVYDHYPVLWVSWQNASDYCSWAGKRLPTEAEWEKAARGVEPRSFPWGEEPATCDLANFWVEEEDGGGYYCVGDTSQVGSYPAGASAYGVMDMGGNVWEWVSDWYASDYYESLPYDNPTGPESGIYKVVRGGSWFCRWGELRTAKRHFNHPSVFYYTIGFRCVRPGN